MILPKNRQKSGVQRYHPSVVGMGPIASVMDRKVAKNLPGATGTGSIVTVEIHKMVLNHPISGVQKLALDALGMGNNASAPDQKVQHKPKVSSPLKNQEKSGVLK